MNSSSKLGSFTFYLANGTYVANIGADSSLKISKSLINQNSIGKSIVSSGRVELEYLTVFSDFPFEALCLYKSDESSDLDTSLTISHSSFHNFCLIRNNGNTFISSGICNVEEIIDCLFSNITSIFDYKRYNYKEKGSNNNNNKEEEEEVSVDYCLLKGTEMIKVEDNFYGGIVSGLTKKTKRVFVCDNCSFIDNFRERSVQRRLRCNNNNSNSNSNSNSNKFINYNLKSSYIIRSNSFVSIHDHGINVIDDAECLYVHTSFIDCRAFGSSSVPSQVNGGGIYCYNTTYSNISSCNFDNCSCGFFGGGIYMCNVQQFVLYSCNFTDCNSTTHVGGGIYMENITKCCSVSDSIFDTCRGSKLGDLGGGGILIVGRVACGGTCKESNSYVIYRCYFYRCSSYREGGGIYISSSDPVCIGFCLFNICSVNVFKEYNFGGGISVDTIKRSDFNHIIVACLFNGGVASKGKDIYFSNSSTELNSNSIYLSYTDDTNNSCKTNDTDCSDWLSVSEDYNWKAYVSVSGTDNEECVNTVLTSAECNTIYYAVRNGYISSGSFTVYLNSTICNNDTNMITVPYMLMVIITNSNHKDVTLSINSFNNNDDTFFYVDRGNLSLVSFALSVDQSNFYAYICKLDNLGVLILKNMTFKSKEDCLLEYSLFNFLLGNVDFTNVTCSNISFNDCSVFDYSISCSFSFSNTSFNNINRGNGDGSVFNIKLESFHLISLENISFKNCSCSKGNGGAIYASLRDPDRLSLKKSSFEGCTAGGYGDYFFIVCSDLSKVSFHLRDYPTAFNSSMNKNDAVGIVNDDSFDYVSLITLGFFPEVLYVKNDSSGLSQNECGFEDNPCNSLQIAFDILGTGNKKNVIIVGTLIINEIIVLSETSYNFQSSNSSSKLECVDGGRYSISVDCNFVGLSFNIPSRINGNNYFDVISDKEHNIIFENCNFIASSNEISGNYNYFNLQNFILNLTKCNFRSDNSNNYNNGDTSAAIPEISISQPLIYLSSNRLIFNKSNLTGFKCLDSSSSVIIIVSGNEVEIDNSSFISCKTENGCGGVINALVGNSASTDRFVIGNASDVTFSNCNALKGGAIYLRIEDYNPEYLLKNLIFNNNNAEYGKNVFIEAYDLSGVANKLKEGWEYIFSEDLLFDKFMGMGLDENNDSNILPLVIFVKMRSEYIYINNEGYNNNYCGYSDYPCVSLSKAFSLVSDSEQKYISVIDSINVNESVSLSYTSYSLTNCTENSVIIIGSDCIFNIFVSSDFEGLFFSFNSFVSNPEALLFLFDSDSSNFKFSNCSFYPTDIQNSLNYSIFVIKHGNLSLTNVMFSSGSEDSNDKVSIISNKKSYLFGDSGEVSLIGCNFNYLTCNNDESPIMINNNCNLIINDCSFSSCKSESGNGGVINEIVEGSSSYQISLGNESDVSFTSNSAKKGGAIYLRIMDDGAKYLLKNLIFNNNNADYGTNLFIEAYDLPSVVNKLKEGWEGIISENVPLSSSMGMILDENNDANIYPLKVTIRTILANLYINYDGCNNKYCGFDDYPCDSFESALNQFSDKISKILIKERLNVGSVVSLSSFSYSISNVSDKACLFCDGGSFVTSVDCLFSYLDFSLSSLSSSLPSSLFDIKGGVFNVNFCNFYGCTSSSSCSNSLSSSLSSRNSGYLNIDLFYLDGGRMNIENSIIKDISFTSSHCGFYINASHDSVYCSFNNLSSSDISVDNNPFITIMEGATSSFEMYRKNYYRNDCIHSFTFDSCSFSDITASFSSPSPSLLSPLSSLFIYFNLSLSNTSISNCVSESSVDGGAIKITLGESCICNIKNSSGEECVCNINEGRGGFLFVDNIYQKSSIPTSLPSIHVTLSSLILMNNKGKYGSDIFISCYSFDKQVDGAKLVGGVIIEGSDESGELKEGMIGGCGLNEEGEETDYVDLSAFATSAFTSFFVYISSVGGETVSSDACGSKKSPCEGIEEGIEHIKDGEISRIGIIKRGKLRKRVTFKNINLTSIDDEGGKGIIDIDCIISKDEKEVIEVQEKVKVENIIFVFCSSFSCSSSLFSCCENANLYLENVWIGGNEKEGNKKQSSDVSERIECNILRGECLCNIYIDNLILNGVRFTTDLFVFGKGAVVDINKINIDSVVTNDYSIFNVNDNSGSFSSNTIFNLSMSSFNNISSSRPLISSSSSLSLNILHSSFNYTSSNIISYGALASFSNVNSLYFNACFIIMGNEGETKEEEGEEREDSICEWEGGMIVMSGGKGVFEEMSFNNCSNGCIEIKEGGEGKIINNVFYSSNSLSENSKSSTFSSSSTFYSSSVSSTSPFPSHSPSHSSSHSPSHSPYTESSSSSSYSVVRKEK